MLAAPDIDADVFKRDLAPRLAVTGANVVLYSSNSDQALSLSRRVHGYRRAGDFSDGVLVADGVDTIDASGIDTSLLGHGYYAAVKVVLSDIEGVFTTGWRADKRAGLCCPASAIIGNSPPIVARNRNMGHERTRSGREVGRSC